MAAPSRSALLGRFGRPAVAAGLAGRGHAGARRRLAPRRGPALHAQGGHRRAGAGLTWPRWSIAIRRAGAQVRPGLAKRRHRLPRGHPLPRRRRRAPSLDWRTRSRRQRRSAARPRASSPVRGPRPPCRPLGLEQQRFLWAAALASGCAVTARADRHRPGVEEPAEAHREVGRRMTPGTVWLASCPKSGSPGSGR